MYALLCVFVRACEHVYSRFVMFTYLLPLVELMFSLLMTTSLTSYRPSSRLSMVTLVVVTRSGFTGFHECVISTLYSTCTAVTASHPLSVIVYKRTIHSFTHTPFKCTIRKQQYFRKCYCNMLHCSVQEISRHD